MKYQFGTKGIWHKPASENTKARNIPAVVLEHQSHGPLYLFTLEPIVKGHDNLTNRTVTTLESDFTPDKGQVNELVLAERRRIKQKLEMFYGFGSERAIEVVQ